MSLPTGKSSDQNRFTSMTSIITTFTLVAVITLIVYPWVVPVLKPLGDLNDRTFGAIPPTDPPDTPSGGP